MLVAVAEHATVGADRRLACLAVVVKRGLVLRTGLLLALLRLLLLLLHHLHHVREETARHELVAPQ